MLLNIKGNTTQHDSMTEAFVYMYSIGEDPKCFTKHTTKKNGIIRVRIIKAIIDARKIIKEREQCTKM